ncbi:MAG: YceI family protein [Nakamurella sp.]
MTATNTTVAPELTGSWNADSVHSELSFKVRHMGVGKAGGTVPLKEGTLTFGAQGIIDGSVVVVADAANLETKNDQRNGHVKSDDFLDVENYPTINFRSTGVRDFDGETFELDGEITIRGITKPLTLKAEFLGAIIDASGTPRAGFAATGTLNRKEFGVKFAPVFGVSNAVVSDKVELTIEAEFIRP